MAGPSVQVTGNVGPVTSGSGTNPVLRQGSTGEVISQDAHGRYYEANVRGNVFCLTVNGAAATAFTGGAGGTPLCSIYNPTGSGKNLVLISASIGSRVAASAAGTVGFNIWGGVSAANTGTLTTPTNLATLVAAGSVARGSSNAATTSTTAISGNGPLYNVGSYYWATAAGAALAPLQADIAGQIICPPGCLVALGATAALTSATYDASLVWEEVPITA